MSSDTAGSHAAVRFDDRVKCCTYLPVLPNYLVGQCLADPTVPAAGVASIVARIEHGPGATPLGLAHPPIYAITYETVGDRCFGRSPALQCPHLLPESGQCGIWNHRNSVCSTWFCKYDGGRAGFRQWQAIAALLGLAERSLSLWVCRSLDIGIDALRELCSYRDAKTVDLLGAELRGSWPLAAGRLWGPWLGRERDFYREAADLVGALSWSAILEIGGSELEILAQLARDAVEKRALPAPTLVQLGAFRIHGGREGTPLLETYSPYDCLPVGPETLVTVLRRLPNRRRRDLRELGLSQSSVEALLAHGVLVAPEFEEQGKAAGTRGGDP